MQVFQKKQLFVIYIRLIRLYRGCAGGFFDKTYWSATISLISYIMIRTPWRSVSVLWVNRPLLKIVIFKPIVCRFKIEVCGYLTRGFGYFWKASKVRRYSYESEISLVLRFHEIISEKFSLISSISANTIIIHYFVNVNT